MTTETLSLAGKTALITGSGRENGVGAAIARSLARNGASVAIHYVSEDSKARAEKVATSIAQEFGTKTTVVHGSVDDYDAFNAMVVQALTALDIDHIDILVNNAGDGYFQPLMEITPEQLKQSFGVNVFGPLYMTQAAVKEGKMPRGGRIINIGSIASKFGHHAGAAYAAAKAAPDSFTAPWSGELGYTNALGRERGITVNTITLGPILTDMSKLFLETADGSPSEIQGVLLTQARAGPRLGTVEDVADATLLLVSEKSRWITA